MNACLEHLIALNNLGGSSCSSGGTDVLGTDTPSQWEKFVSCICSSCSGKELLDKRGKYAYYKPKLFVIPYLLLYMPSPSLPPPKSKLFAIPYLLMYVPSPPHPPTLSSPSLPLSFCPSFCPSLLPSLIQRLHHSCQRPTVLLLDDNMPLRSMRYEYHQMARKCMPTTTHSDF